MAVKSDRIVLPPLNFMSDNAHSAVPEEGIKLAPPVITCEDSATLESKKQPPSESTDATVVEPTTPKAKDTASDRSAPIAAPNAAPNTAPSAEKSTAPMPPPEAQAAASQNNTLSPVPPASATPALSPAPPASNAASPTPLTTPQQQPSTTSPKLQSLERRQERPTINGDNHVCANCGTTETPLWRRGPEDQVLCNACGLYIKARNIHRPVTLKRMPVTKTVSAKEIMGSCPGDGRCNGTGGSSSCSRCPSFINNSRRNATLNESSDQKDVSLISCQNCGTVNTPLWRRDVQGHIICNACGLYNRMHKDVRPADLQSAIVRRRKRVRSDKPVDIAQKPSKSPALSPVQGQKPVRTPSETKVNAQAPQAPIPAPQQVPMVSHLPPPQSLPVPHDHHHFKKEGHELCCQHLNPTLVQQSHSPPHQQFPPPPGAYYQQVPYGYMPIPPMQYAYHPQAPPQPATQAPPPPPPHNAPTQVSQPPPAQPAAAQPPVTSPATLPVQTASSTTQPPVSDSSQRPVEPRYVVDNGYSPLSVLQYLNGASNDTKKEYLLAAQRQLHDRVDDLRNKLKGAEAQLFDCERALRLFNQQE